VNLWIKTPDLKTLSHMYRQAWHVGLKTTYYLRSLGASNIEKATVAVKKEVRGAIKEGQDGGQNSGDTGGTHSIAQVKADAAAAALTVSGNKAYTPEQKKACSIDAMRRGEECEACQ
jgi:ribonucleoside-diphosphate reductase alpha chain